MRDAVYAIVCAVATLVFLMTCDAHGQIGVAPLNTGERFVSISTRGPNDSQDYSGGGVRISGNYAEFWIRTEKGYFNGVDYIPGSYEKATITFYRTDTRFKIVLGGSLSGTGYIQQGGYTAYSPTDAPHPGAGPMEISGPGNGQPDSETSWTIRVYMAGEWMSIPYVDEEEDPGDPPGSDDPTIDFDAGDPFANEYDYTPGGGGGINISIPISNMPIGGQALTTVTTAPITFDWYMSSPLKPMIDVVMMGFATWTAWLMPIKELKKGGAD
ncbi:MAG: hypothetical protein AAF663_01740 [Planctomycetota bacterium]